MPADFSRVAEVVNDIRQSERSGTEVDRGRVSIANASSLDVSLAWYASVLAHEARHVRLYLIEGKHRTGNAVFEAEVDCNTVQMRVLQRVGGSDKELAWLARQVDGRHPDVDGDGKYSWEDYYQRKW